MNDKRLVMYDGTNTNDNISINNSGYTAFNTSIDIKCIETGEVIFKGLKNKVILPGSGLIARKLFDIETPEITPSYNEAFGTAMYTPETDAVPDLPNTSATKSNHKVLLFCCGTDGCGTENSQVYPVDYRKWIRPEDMVPFRFQVENNDLSDDLRQSYFGRTTIDGGYLAYYFKRFEREVKFVQQYVDGTPVDGNVYDAVTNTEAETYVELSLRITKEDIRDYFIATTGIDEAKINSISLCSGYPVQDSDGYMYFKEIRPLTKLNIPNEQLIDTTKGIEIIYHIYM